MLPGDVDAVLPVVLDDVSCEHTTNVTRTAAEKRRPPQSVGRNRFPVMVIGQFVK
jgi:hypothetical protein